MNLFQIKRHHRSYRQHCLDLYSTADIRCLSCERGQGMDDQL